MEGSVKIEIFDFSEYGNKDDRYSDSRIASALEKLGCQTRIRHIGAGSDCHADGRNIWLRYDARTMDDLRFVTDIARKFENENRRVFPSSDAIMNSEDKWLSYLAFVSKGIPAVPSFPVTDIAKAGKTALIKPRPGWGGMGQRLVEDSGLFREFAEFPDTSFFCQPFVSHSRTITVLAAGGIPFIAIEKKTGAKDFRTDEYHGGTARRFDAPKIFVELALRSLSAVGIGAGSVDMIENEGRAEVLEVNSAPGLFYTDIPSFDFALPLAKFAVENCFSR